MKKTQLTILCIGMLITGLILQPVVNSTAGATQSEPSLISDIKEEIKKEAFEILEAKCNICHRKVFPFMVFNERNMIRRAKKIYQMVFVERRMPKGNEITLSTEEFQTLRTWLNTQNIY